MNSIFGKALEAVAYDDVVAFAALQQKEGLNLDYKVNVSSLSKIVKTLVSFANTNGGWVIVGIGDEDDKPKLPITGMVYGEDYEQKINNAIISMVNPIVLPFYRVVHSVDKKHTILIAYMPMSAGAPHWMNYEGKNILFTRVADRANGKDWEVYASEHAWEMLREKRQASEALRDQLRETMGEIRIASHRHAELTSDDPYNIMAESEDNTIAALLAPAARPPKPAGRSSIRIIQQYPNEQLMTVPEIEARLRDVIVSIDPSVSPISTPDVRGGLIMTFQQGAYVSYKHSDYKNHYFFGLDVFGTILNVNPVERSRKIDGQTISFVEAQDIIGSIVGALKYAGQLYNDLGHETLLNIECDINVSGGTLLYRPGRGLDSWPWRTQNPPANLKGEYNVNKVVNSGELTDINNIVALTAEIVGEIMHSFNYSYYNTEAVLAEIKYLARL